jgi:hypothetical protein
VERSGTPGINARKFVKSAKRPIEEPSPMTC